MNEKNENIPQNIILENRRKISISGSVIYTCMGLLEIKGCELHMSKLNLDSGEIVLEGHFDSFSYIDSPTPEKSAAKPGLLKRLFGQEE